MTQADNTDATPPETPLQRYVALRKAGDVQAAVAAAREACATTPNVPAAHYALGEALAALGDSDGAVAGFAAALRLAPLWADAWVNLGLARYRQGAPGAAKLAMREAMRVEPGHAAAAGNLGALMRISGEAESGEALLRATLAQAPESEGVRLNLAAELLQREQGAEALAVLDAAPSLPTGAAALRQWHLTRVMALLQQGAVAQAHKTMADFAAIGPIPPALAPLWHWRRVLLAQLQQDEAAAEAAAADMAAAIPQMGPDAVPEHRIMAHYDLAKFWSSRNNHQAAFNHWQAGHSLLRLSQPFSREAFSAFIESNISYFPAARFQDGPRAQNSDPAPVFIVGMPRSGTTLCEQILAAHNAVHGAGERAALGQMANRLVGSHNTAIERLAALDAATLDEAAAQYLAELHALAPDKTLIIDKMPGNELYLALVGLMLPAAKIIHCVRDPRDIGLSIWTYRFHGEHPYAHDLADLGWTIAQRLRLMDHWRAALPNPILTIALQDWVKDFDGTLTRVLTHLNLPPDPACTRFYENDRDVRTVSRAQVRQPVHNRGLGRWRSYAPQLAPLIAELTAAGVLGEEVAPEG